MYTHTQACVNVLYYATCTVHKRGVKVCVCERERRRERERESQRYRQTDTHRQKGHSARYMDEESVCVREREGERESKI